MNIFFVAKRLGGEVVGRNRVLVPGPGHSTRDRSLSVKLMPSGFVCHSFAGDDPMVCRDHVRSRLGLPSFKPEKKCEFNFASRGNCPDRSIDEAGRRDLALSIWREAMAIAGTAAEFYIRARHLPPTDNEALRFHPRCPFHLADGTVRLPAMLGLMRDIVTNEPTGIHRTALRPDGSGKADIDRAKRMLGIARGAVVKLMADEDVADGLHIAEGIETALACIGHGLRPTWACLSAGGIERFPVLSGIDALTILADHDESGTGQRAAKACAERWQAAGCEVRVITPPAVGSDWGDAP
jgi:hypothetical protein